MNKEETQKLLSIIFNPFPQYFLEQIHVIKLINSIDSNLYNMAELPLTINQIVQKIFENPNPNVVKEIPNLLRNNYFLSYSILTSVRYKMPISHTVKWASCVIRLKQIDTFHYK